MCFSLGKTSFPCLIIGAKADKGFPTQSTSVTISLLHNRHKCGSCNVLAKSPSSTWGALHDGQEITVLSRPASVLAMRAWQHLTRNDSSPTLSAKPNFSLAVSLFLKKWVNLGPEGGASRCLLVGGGVGEPSELLS